MPGVSNLAILLLSSLSFHFCYPFCVTTVFDDRQGRVTLSCKEPTGENKGNIKKKDFTCMTKDAKFYQNRKFDFLTSCQNRI